MSINVRAEMMATVWQVPVEKGQAVSEGDHLVILESMKMEIPVRAPAAGRVEALHVAPDDHVEKGDLLVVLDS